MPRVGCALAGPADRLGLERFGIVRRQHGDQRRRLGLRAGDGKHTEKAVMTDDEIWNRLAYLGAIAGSDQPGRLILIASGTAVPERRVNAQVVANDGTAIVTTGSDIRATLGMLETGIYNHGRNEVSPRV
jgi:hypothetical protein